MVLTGNAAFDRPLKSSRGRSAFSRGCQRPGALPLFQRLTGILQCLRSGREELRQAGEIVGGQEEDDAGTHLPDAVTGCLSHAADGLIPAESLFVPIAVALGSA